MIPGDLLSLSSAKFRLTSDMRHLTLRQQQP